MAFHIECEPPLVNNIGFVFGCIANEKINYCKVEHGGKICNFKIVNYKMQADERQCEASLKARISVQQANSRKNCTFTITNVEKKGELERF